MKLLLASEMSMVGIILPSTKYILSRINAQTALRPSLDIGNVKVCLLKEGGKRT